MRIDKLIWFLRLAKTRTIAQTMAEEGHMRLNGRRVERAHQKVSQGDILTLATPSGVRVIEIVTLPIRRGPAPEAQACYRVLDGGADNPIAAAFRNEA
ncbi:RNA-binding S4 domain-containing protein [Novosphingobium pentaromativorans]|uniref:Ribosome-associated heat shock protein Hsp15 n=1 Tax=Novosphingobium pentaromativorans US6-1 TaxID=1088721 RepID=G6EBJ3_9SPHN|nr:S4 domain-containing protein [Novosphingobium pentaromativorans]AIT80361.1 RNA-binding protein [Novosphingobium pentaromativorans US6-1]EHJ61275.1 ribosome-associated heat shock protein Hsp15 [Novosphingobium pentaromativorans US6-1]